MKTTQRRDQAGFTMIEFLVVVGIIGILIGITIPTLLQARVPAQDRQAQTLLRNSLTAAKAIETSDGLGPTRVQLGVEEQGVRFLLSVATAPASQRSVSVDSGTEGSGWYMILAAQSSSGRCFALLERQGQAPRFQRVDNASTCRAAQFDTSTGWVGRWP